MTTKRRTDYQVDEEALKRMMAGDVTALERTVPPEEEPETKSQAGPCPEKQEKKSGSSRQQIKKTPDGAADSDGIPEPVSESETIGSKKADLY